ncbi:hypothetical protein LCGC14_0553490 [marine sediment metagenome]|uniref:Uncharacterized protein n=1 Tax=marine sediment metagenome TaxID=412755 RepID=A0A0F9RU66_9ZZZZ
MAALHGRRGIVDFTGLTFEITSFTVDATADTAESTILNSAAVTSATHWKSYLAGYKDWTATVEAVLPVAGAGLAALGTTAALGLDTTDGLDWAGNAICTGVSMSNGTDDVARATFAFQGIAALTAS